MNGALAIALPTKLGQSLKVKPTRGSDLIWVSLDSKGNRWFEANISLYDFSAIKTNDQKKAAFLSKILRNAVRLNSEFLDKWNGFKVETSLEFPLNWGLGSSSSLIYTVAQWAEVNPFYLHFKISNGSGYDIACAGSEGPLKYQLKNDELEYTSLDFKPNYLDRLYFVYLGEKANSNASIEYYSKNVIGKKNLAQQITKISHEILSSKSLPEFRELIDLHEEILSKSLNLPKVKEKLFADYWSSVKSLGAWGGDFALATSERSEDETRSYFKSKQLDIVFRYEDLILH